MILLLISLLLCDHAFYHYQYYECPGNIEIDGNIYEVYKDTTITVIKECDTYRHHIHIIDCDEVELILPSYWKDTETFRVVGEYPFRCILRQNGVIIADWDQINSLSGVKISANFRDPLSLLVLDKDYKIHTKYINWVPTYPKPPM